MRGPLGLESIAMKRLISAERSTSINSGMLMRSNIPERYWKVQLDAVAESPSFKESIKNYCVHIAERTGDGKGVYIFGEHGVGKTSLAIFIMKEILMHGGKVYFLPARDITEVYYNDLATPSDYLSGESIPVKDRLRECHLVVLDDLGSESWNPQKAGGAELERFFREQYENKGTVVVTGVLHSGQLGDRYTKPVKNLISRMTEHIKVESTQWI